MSSLGLNAPMLNMLVTGSQGATTENEHEKSINLQYEFEGMPRMKLCLRLFRDDATFSTEDIIDY